MKACIKFLWRYGPILGASICLVHSVLQTLALVILLNLLKFYRLNIRLNVKRANRFERELEWYLKVLESEGEKLLKALYTAGKKTQCCFKLDVISFRNLCMFSL